MLMMPEPPRLVFRYSAYGRAFAETVFGHGKHLVRLIDDYHAHDPVVGVKFDAAHAPGIAPQFPRRALVEPYGLAFARAEDDVVITICQFAFDHDVAFVKIDGVDAVPADVRVGHERLFVDNAAAGHGHDEMGFVEFLYGHKGGDGFLGPKAEQVDDGLAPRLPAGLGDPVHFKPVAPAGVRKEKNIRMRRGDEQVLHEIVFLGIHSQDAAAAAPLRAVGGHRGAFDIAGMGHGDHHVFIGYQVFYFNVAGSFDDFGPAVVAETALEVDKFGS